MRSLIGTPRQALTGSTLGFFVGFASVALFGPTAAKFQQILHLSPIRVGFLVAAPALSGSLLRIPFSAWVDTTGGRKPFLILLSLSLIGMLGIFGLVEIFGSQHLPACVYPLLLGLGFLCGCGIATFSVGISQVSYWFPQSHQGTALAIYAGLGNLAPGIFSYLLPVAVLYWGFARSYFGWLLILAAGTLLYARLGRNAWYFQLISRNVQPEDARSLAAKEGQTLFPAASLSASLRTSARAWRTWALVCLYFTTFGGFIALTSWLPVFWSLSFHAAAVTAGLLTALYSILASSIRIVGGVLSDHPEVGAENIAHLGLMIMLSGAIVMTIPGHFELAVLGEIFLAIGMGTCNAAVFKILPRAVPDSVGGAAGWVGGLGALGGFLMPPLMALIARHMGRQGYSAGFVLFILFGLASLAVVAVLKSKVFSPPLAIQPEASGRQDEAIGRALEATDF